MNPLGTDDVGQRVTVRALTGRLGPTGGPQFTDTVGRLVRVDEEHLAIERRDGSITHVERAAIVAAKRIPGRPRRSRPAHGVGADDLLRITSRGWPAVHSEPLGEWELRAAGGFTGRANSAAVHGDPGLPFAEALKAIVAFAERHAIAPAAQVVVGSPWHGRFLDAGWEPLRTSRPGAIVQVADIGAHEPDPAVTITSRASEEWLARYGRVEDPAIARAVLEGPERVGFATLEGSAIGRVVVTGEWAGLAAVEVDPAERRRGLARRLVTSCLAWAVGQGADKAYLQVMRDNLPARQLYAPFGFATHHEYLYLQPPRIALPSAVE
ncbi:GNAT family N-acetyltransferase [Aeromicrobium phragmitis]|uniref:GNAT family N-acetyltransferase n=1 Tax=Aeromicrobium phragmitis TaxID=2478914 RepID=A0A3L8PK79_9ACTN|nr:GNAT family N-acetyltransferase [Aeromicrobium phragmitis]RLV55806.1 GNAT family N-acetyltransferase [Aeromicrobium phragmitis]